MDTGSTVKVSSGGGIGIGTLAWIALIVLKALGYISMGWFWVITGFIWIPIGIFLVIFILLMVFVVIGVVVAALIDR